MKKESIHKESGRSMVEMLGVLAVIGVLSVSGIWGYTYGMNKHKANELARQIVIRAQDISASLKNGGDPEDFTDEMFGSEIIPAGYDDAHKKYTSAIIPSAGDDKFSIVIDKVSPEICKHLLNNIINTEMGVQQIQQTINNATKDIKKTSDCNPEDLSELGFIFDANLESVCDPGKYKKEGLCEEAPDGYIAPGDGSLTKCEKGMTSDATHTKCVACAKGDTTCGCEKMANGTGGCMDCFKNNNCAALRYCGDNGACYQCPKYADCSKEQGFTCKEGYTQSTYMCCPQNAICSIDDKGNFEEKCSNGYYYVEDSDKNVSCLECPINADCKGGKEGYVCKTGFVDQKENKICCPEGATCTKVGDDYTVSCSKGTYLVEKACLPCPKNATCPGGDALPTCGSGYIFAQNECQKTNCIQGEAGRYNCYLNGRQCGYYCTDTEMKKESCRGYCQDFCPAGTTWGNVVIGWSGFGCSDNKTGIYCGTTYGGWLCTQNNTTSTVCCEASNIAQCVHGTCSPSDCDQFNVNGMTATYGYVSDRAYGCIIKKDTQTIYCFPKDGNWYCKRATSPSWNVAHCGTCSTNALKNGTGCTDCFDSSTNCTNWAKTDPNVKWNETLQACVGKGLDGNTYTCQLNSYCYLGEGITQRCGYGCNSITPDSCEINVGLCNQTKCPAGTTYFYNAKFNISGCKKPYTGAEGGYLFYRPGSWGNYTCYYGKTEDAIVSTCGYGCQGKKDCSDCATPILSQCMQTNCSQNGMEIKNCTCTGSVSNNHCCPPNHTYINGTCVIVNMAGKCLFKGYIVANETADYKADASGNCVCTDTATKCLSEAGLTPVCSTVSATLIRDANGKCKTVDPAP